jgi:hypothetical protein
MIANLPSARIASMADTMPELVLVDQSDAVDSIDYGPDLHGSASHNRDFFPNPALHHAPLR